MAFLFDELTMDVPCAQLGQQQQVHFLQTLKD